MADTHGPSGGGSTPGVMWVYCLCGWQSAPVDVTHPGWYEALMAAYAAHIAEVTP